MYLSLYVSVCQPSYTYHYMWLYINNHVLITRVYMSAIMYLLHTWLYVNHHVLSTRFCMSTIMHLSLNVTVCQPSCTHYTWQYVNNHVLIPRDWISTILYSFHVTVCQPSCIYHYTWLYVNHHVLIITRDCMSTTMYLSLHVTVCQPSCIYHDKQAVNAPCPDKQALTIWPRNHFYRAILAHFQSKGHTYRFRFPGKCIAIRAWLVYFTDRSHFV